MNYKKIYDNLITKAKSRTPVNQYTEKHHIIPLCIGGTNKSENIVKLTPREHFLAHLLLMKIYPNEYKLVYAAMKMTRGRNGVNTSRKYEWLRKKYSQVRKELIRENSPTKNKKWISNFDETILVEKTIAEDLVNSGKYVYGKSTRKMFSCQICDKILTKKCENCRKLSIKTSNYEKNKKKAEKLFQEFIESNSKSVTEFAKIVGTSQPKLSNLWAKYVEDYKLNKKQGKSFKEKHQ